MIAPSPIRIGTRKSALAIIQAEEVVTAFAEPCEIVPLISSGDKVPGPLRDFGGKSLFTKELDRALLQGDIDLAVHSMKDVETPLPKGLVIAAVLPREDPRDLLISRPGSKPTTIGTSSLRRACQLKFYNPALCILPCRGNVQTRLQKYLDREFDRLVLAVAGLKRLGLLTDNGIIGVEADLEFLNIDQYVPAPGQGALVVLKRANDQRFVAVSEKLNHTDSLLAIEIERAVVEGLKLTCHDPVGVYVQVTGDNFTLRFMLFGKEQSPIERVICGKVADWHRVVQEMIASVSKG